MRRIHRSKSMTGMNGRPAVLIYESDYRKMLAVIKTAEACDTLQAFDNWGKYLRIALNRFNAKVKK